MITVTVVHSGLECVCVCVWAGGDSVFFCSLLVDAGAVIV